MNHSLLKMAERYPVGIYLLKVNDKNRTMCEICSELTIKTPERLSGYQWSTKYAKIIKKKDICPVNIFLFSFVLKNNRHHLSVGITSLSQAA